MHRNMSRRLRNRLLADLIKANYHGRPNMTTEAILLCEWLNEVGYDLGIDPEHCRTLSSIRDELECRLVNGDDWSIKPGKEQDE